MIFCSIILTDHCYHVVKGYILLKMGNIKSGKKEQGESETLFDEIKMELCAF